MHYPYDYFIKYLLVVAHYTPSQVRDFFARTDFVPPEIEKIRLIRQAVLYKLKSKKAKSDFRKGKAVAKRWLQELGLHVLNNKILEELSEIIKVVEVRRTIEVLILKKVSSTAISEIIFQKFRANIPSPIITVYRKFLWNKDELKFSKWVRYISQIMDTKELGIRSDALWKDPEYIAGKLDINKDIDPEFVDKMIMRDHFLKSRELLASDSESSVNHAKIALRAAANLMSYSEAKRSDKQRQDFIDKILLENRKFEIPSIHDADAFKDSAVDIPFEPLAALEGAKEEATEVADIPEPKKKKKKRSRIVKDSMAPEEPADDNITIDDLFFTDKE